MIFTVALLFYLTYIIQLVEVSWLIRAIKRVLFCFLHSSNSILCEELFLIAHFHLLKKQMIFQTLSLHFLLKNILQMFFIGDSWFSPCHTVMKISIKWPPWWYLTLRLNQQSLPPLSFQLILNYQIRCQISFFYNNNNNNNNNNSHLILLRLKFDRLSKPFWLHGEYRFVWSSALW